MYMDLVGNTIGYEEVIANELLSSTPRVYWFEGVESTVQGFRLYTKGVNTKTYSKGYHGVMGYYTIYKANNDPSQADLCLYHGKTNSIGRRLSRFYKEVKNKSHPLENHPAGKKYRETWSDDVSDVYIKLYPCNPKDFSEDIELEMIRSLRPLFNRVVTKRKSKNSC